MSQITTHILDTSVGRPAEGIHVTLERTNGKHEWEKIGDDVTNVDGRIAALVPPGISLPSGVYRLFFETKTYFDRQKVKGFYPYIHIVFEITEDRHYHVPLLLNPFGYSTYRGS